LHRKNVCLGKVPGRTSTCSPNESLDHGPDEGKKTKICTKNGIDRFTKPGQREETAKVTILDTEDD
jgi:hypothetical protein